MANIYIRADMLMIAFAIIISFIAYKNFMKADKLLNTSITTPKTITKEVVTTNRDPLYERDVQVALNPFAPPTQRISRLSISNPEVYRYFNHPTQGYPDNYQLLGHLHRSSDNKIVKLFGRRKYRGSDQYDYYGTTVLDDQSIKVDVDVPRDSKLYDGDTVTIDLLGNSETFTFHEFEMEELRYNPYVI